MKYYSILLMTLLCFANTYAQNLVIPERSVPIIHADFSEWVLVYNDDVKTSKLENDKTYYWLKAKHIHTSKGGYEGHLLHGEYTALYKDNALKEKGSFYKGLKSGEWKTWYPNGEIMQISRWRKGKISGAISYYNSEGKLIKKENYKSGLQHGSQIVYNDSSEVIIKFRNGKEIIKKPKRVKTKVEKGEKIDEPTIEENKTIPAKKKRIRKSKAKNEEPKKETKDPKTKKDNKKQIEKV